VSKQSLTPTRTDTFELFHTDNCTSTDNNTRNDQKYTKRQTNTKKNEIYNELTLYKKLKQTIRVLGDRIRFRDRDFQKENNNLAIM